VIARLLLPLVRLGVRRPVAVLGALAAITLAATGALRTFRVEPDISRMLPGSPAVDLFRAVEARTAGGRSLLIAVHDDPGRLEQTMRELAARLRTSPFLTRVRATRNEWFGDDQGIAPLWALSESERDALRRRLTTDRRAALEEMLADLAADPFGGEQVALADPLGVRGVLEGAGRRATPLPLADSDFVILAGGRVGVLLAVGAREPYDADFARALLADVEARLAPARCELWGGYVVAREQATGMQHDMTWATTAASLLVGLYLALALRNLVLPLVVLLPPGIAILWALPAGSLLAGPFNVLAVGAAAVLLGLGDDFSMHFFARYGEERAGHAHGEAAERTVHAAGAPIVLGGLTTCAAFASLAFGRFEGLAGFGLLLSLGIVFAIAVTFVLAPALLGVGMLQRLLRVPRPRSALAAALEGVACSRAGLPVAVLLLALGALGVVLVAGRGVRFDVSPAALSPRTSVADRHRERIEELVGFSPVPVSALLDPAIAPEDLHAGVAHLRARGGIAFVDGPMAALPDAATRRAVEAFRAATDGFVDATLGDLRALEVDPEPFAPALRRLADLLARDPAPADARHFVGTDGNRRLLLVCYPERSVRSETDWQRFRAAVHEAFGPLGEPFGSQALLGEVRRVLLHDLTTCTFATACIVVVLAFLLTRGWSLTLLAVTPVVVGTSITVGALVLLDVPLNLANFIAIPFVLGIGADDGLHLASHYRECGARAAPGVVGIAICRTTVTTALGFGALLAAENPGLRSFGAIASVGVAVNLIVSFLVIVPLVRRTVRSA